MACEPIRSEMLPRQAETMRLTAVSVVRLMARDPRGALAPAQRAVALEPDAAIAHDQLSVVWNALGVEPKASEEIARTFILSRTFPLRERLNAEMRYWMSLNRWDDALGRAQQQYAMRPQVLDGGLQVVALLKGRGRMEDATALVHELQRLPAPLGDDPRIDLELATSNLPRAEAEAAFARARAKLLARGPKDLLSSLRAFERDRAYAEGDLDSAERQTRQRVAEALAPTNPQMLTWELHLWAAMRFHGRGDVAGAIALLTAELALLEQTGIVHQRANFHLLWGNVFQALDQPEAAQRSQEQALAVFRQACSHGCEVYAVTNLASGALEDGRLGDVERQVRRGLELLVAWPNPPMEGRLRTLLGEVLLGQGDLAGAAAELERAAPLDAGDPNMNGWSQLLRARLSAASGDRALAETQVREAIRDFEIHRRGDRLFAARLLLGELQLGHDRAAGKKTLGDLEREASAAGYRFMARKAREALSRR